MWRELAIQPSISLQLIFFIRVISHCVSWNGSPKSQPHFMLTKSYSGMFLWVLCLVLPSILLPSNQITFLAFLTFNFVRICANQTPSKPLSTPTERLVVMSLAVVCHRLKALRGLSLASCSNKT